MSCVVLSDFVKVLCRYGVYICLICIHATTPFLFNLQAGAQLRAGATSCTPPMRGDKARERRATPSLLAHYPAHVSPSLRFALPREPEVAVASDASCRRSAPPRSNPRLPQAPPPSPLHLRQVSRAGTPEARRNRRHRGRLLRGRPPDASDRFAAYYPPPTSPSPPLNSW